MKGNYTDLEINLQISLTEDLIKVFLNVTIYTRYN